MSDFQATAGLAAAETRAPAEGGLSLRDLLPLLRRHLLLLVLGPLLAGAAALGVTYLIAPTFTAATTFLPPQQSQSAASAAIASLGALSGLAGGAAGLRTPADQYISLMQSVTVSDRIIDQFKLLDVYGEKLRVDTRRRLAKNVRIAVGKKDGLITVEVDDTDPQRAADMANRYVEELRRMTETLAVSEAQQRRAFFEHHLQKARENLTRAQQVLQSSGYNQGALNAEPKAAAESYARLLAQATAAEVKLQALRDTLTETAPEIALQRATIGALRAQLARMETANRGNEGSDYIGKYRDFKYQEALFELYARQFELARVDESREGPLIQVVDKAAPPEKRSHPKRGPITGGAVVLALLVLLLGLVARRAAAAS